MFLIILRRTVAHAFRKGGGALGACAFYLIVATLLAFALGPDAMARHAGAAMALGLLLSVVTALPLFYERDFEDGTLEQFLLLPALLEWLALARILGFWIAVALPILLVSPLVAAMGDVPLHAMRNHLLLLLLASPTLISLGSVAAALTLGHRRGGLLQALLLLPLAAPVLIFAAAAGPGAAILLAAFALASLPLSCWISAALMRLSQE
jgi:heme exporter protein B